MIVSSTVVLNASNGYIELPHPLVGGTCCVYQISEHHWIGKRLDGHIIGKQTIRLIEKTTGEVLVNYQYKLCEKEVYKIKEDPIKRCEYCGTKIIDNQVYCISCGAPT